MFCGFNVYILLVCVCVCWVRAHFACVWGVRCAGAGVVLWGCSVLVLIVCGVRDCVGCVYCVSWLLWVIVSGALVSLLVLFIPCAGYGLDLYLY